MNMPSSCNGGTRNTTKSREITTERQPPNKRLKLAGGDRLKGSGVLCANVHQLSFSDGRASGRVARSLSAIR